MARVAVVTGGYSNVGRAVAVELIARGWSVRTLTNGVRSAGDAALEAFPLVFESRQLAPALRGADVLVNTYWVRMPRHGATFEQAIANSRALVDAAVAASVRRIVQLSVSNASLESPFGYYRGKALVDEYVAARAASWAIVRPTLVVGPRDVLTSNIAWFIRHTPFLGVPSGGTYDLQPVVIDDVARIVADQAGASSCVRRDAAGAERYTFRDYVRLVAAALGRRARLVPLPPRVMLGLLGAVGRVLRDVVLTGEELAGLREGLLVSGELPLGRTSVRAWLLANGEALGRRYVNDLRVRRRSSRAAAAPSRG